MSAYIKTCACILALGLLSIGGLKAGPGDTIKVQTFTFGSPQDAWFELPGLDVSVEKILMKYTLKCNPAQSPACGEWDYLTYTYLYEHTGNLDSTLLTHPYFTANGASPDIFSYSEAPTYTYSPSWNYFIVYDDTLSYATGAVGGTDISANTPFNTMEPRCRTQIIWTAEELLAGGLTAGDITGFDFDLISAGSPINNVVIRMKATDADIFTEPIFESDLLTVFSGDKTFTTGWDGFDFTTPFTWDGVSNIIVDISYENPTEVTAPVFVSEIIPAIVVLNSMNPDKYIEFHNSDVADVFGNPLTGLNEQVTVAFWSKGDPIFQPQNGTTFEAITETGARVLNSHTPWSDANVYWDAGNDGGYDRINKVATAADYEGNWVHWAFTKNATTGSMKIYKNGVLWHSGTSKVKPMTGIDHLRLGKGNWGGSESYAGYMDEFAIWDVELDATTIADYMFKDLNAAHPNAANLQVYYQFNDGDGITEPSSDGAYPLGLVGATTIPVSATDIERNGFFANARPHMRFEQGVYASHLDSVLVVDEIINDPVTLIYYDPSDPTTATDTVLVYPGDYYTYIYAEDGTISDSVFVAVTHTINNEDLPYYSEPFEVINAYELARYITPYGIGLDLGDGFTWTYDLSDYRPLLHDSVHLSAGNWQELLDMELWFIEGTPPRNPIAVEQVYYGFYSYGLTPSFDEQTPPKEVTIPVDAENSRMKIRVTGHGFGGTANCSEFCAREHYFIVDGEEVWSKDVWRDDCDLNPVYPQGGTWVYDRANWCPGAEVWTYDYELTPEVTAGNTYTFDYNAEDYTWNGAGSVPTYVTSVQMVSYGAPNFTLDAALDAIIAPSDDDMQSRKNPICQNPIVRITNTGSTPLTSLDITFGIKDYDQDTYTWTGNLAFMESEEVMLPNFGWTNTGTHFIATVSNPNGGADGYAFNNSITTPLAIPPVYPSEIILDMKTNLASHENDVYLFDQDGNEIFSRTAFTDNTIYKDTFQLEEGCYELIVYDYGEDGLSWWANADGSGWFRVKNIDGVYIMNFDADFGGKIYQQFTVGNYTPVEELPEQPALCTVYPNPADAEVYIKIKLSHLEDVQLTIVDLTGKIIHKENRNRTQSELMRIDTSVLPAGAYMVVMQAGNEMITSQFVVEH